MSETWPVSVSNVQSLFLFQKPLKPESRDSAGEPMDSTTTSRNAEGWNGNDLVDLDLIEG